MNNLRFLELFSLSLKAKTKIKGLIEIVSNAAEFANLPIRYKEDVTLKKLADRLGNQMKSQKWLNPHVKVSPLLAFDYVFALFCSVQSQVKFRQTC